MASSEGLVIALKNVLKSKGIPYSKIAVGLNLNETSVKRFMSGHTSLTLERFDQICEIAGVDFFELVKLVKPQSASSDAQLSIEQEQALADDQFLFLSFYSFLKGLSVEEIVEKYRITKPQLLKACFQLEKMGLASLYPQNQVKILVGKAVKWQDKGPLTKKYEKSMEGDFLNFDFSDTDETRKFHTYLLSPKSKRLFIRKIKELIRDIQSQSEIDLALEKKLKSTTTVLFAIREWSPSLLKGFLK